MTTPMLLSLSIWTALVAAVALVFGHRLAARRANHVLEETLAVAAAEREAVEARIRAPLRIEIKALQDRLTEERQRAAQQVALVEASRQEEVNRWRNVALAPGLHSMGPPDFPDRPSRRELDLIADRVRGVAFVDAVAVADRCGLALSADATIEARALASLAPLAERFRRELPGPAARSTSIQLALDDARYVALRSLPPWTRGAWLMASASYQPPSALALDAALGVALLRQQTPVRSGAQECGALRGFSGTHSGRLTNGQSLGITAELEVYVKKLEARAVALCHERALLAATMADGPSPTECADLCHLLRELHDQAGWQLKVNEVVRIDAFLEEGLIVSYVPLEPGSPLSAVFITTGQPVGTMAVLGFFGRVQRLLAQSPPLIPAISSIQVEVPL